MFDSERGRGGLRKSEAAHQVAVDPGSLAEISWDELEPAAVMELVTTLRRVTMSVDAALATGMASIARTQIAEHACGLSVGTWWAYSRLGCGSQGTWLSRAGELMARFPNIGAALRRGELSLEHLRAIDEIQDRRVVRELEPLDEELSHEAVGLTLARWRRRMRARVALLSDEIDRRAEAEPAEEAAPEGAEPGPRTEEPPAPDPNTCRQHGESPNDTQDSSGLFDSLLDDLDAPGGHEDGWSPCGRRPTAACCCAASSSDRQQSPSVRHSWRRRPGIDASPGGSTTALASPCPAAASCWRGRSCSWSARVSPPRPTLLSPPARKRSW